MPNGLIASPHCDVYTDRNSITENTNQIGEHESLPWRGGSDGAKQLALSTPGVSRRAEVWFWSWFGSRVLHSCYTSGPIMLGDSWTGHQLAHGYYDEQRKMSWMKQTTRWVGFALGAAAESEAVRGPLVGLSQVGAFVSEWEWWGTPGCKESQTTLIVLMAITLQCFGHKEKTKTKTLSSW